MAHFEEGHELVRTVRSVGERPGFRNSQIGAIHAISSHFTLRDEPALVVLPTGAGKTGVLMVVPYVLGVRRALVITQSKFVRSQIASDFSSLRTLRFVGALPEGFGAPKVLERRTRIQSVADWETLRGFDAVITTPSSASPGINGIPDPPADLFDLVLVDEAHHSPARTWNALVKSFPNARVVFFTATPFRRDRKEIKARHLYAYPIQRAFDDGIYGEMVYIPVQPAAGDSADVALAKETAVVFKRDADAGYSHSLMVRVDSRPRAAQLAEIYKTHTTLRLDVVDSGRSARAAEKTVEKLSKGELDGVICVNMLGEGFDLPRLKIAALHSPHRSLGVTLQFFGRFSRMNDVNLGDDTFLAVPAEVDGELRELFDESDTWGKKIRLLGEQRIGDEIKLQEFLQAFDELDTDDPAPPLEDISLHSFTAFNHVKIFELFGDVDLSNIPEVSGFITERVWLNEEEATTVALLREEVRPQWATTPGLDRVEHHLVIVHWSVPGNLMFVCSSHREEGLFKEVVASFTRGLFKTLSLSKANRVLRSFTNLELFNVGIRNRASGVVAESYRQISGSSAQHALDKGDAALYHRGHIFGRGETPQGITTIGVSSLGKLWRLEQTKIPDLVAWCRTLAADINSSAAFTTGIQIDHFDVGQDIVDIPDEIVLAGDWDEQIYKHPWRVEYEGADGQRQACSVLDLDIMVTPTRLDTKTIGFSLHVNGFTTRLKFNIDPVPTIQYLDANQPRISIVRGFKSKDLIEYISEEHIRFHFADGAVLQGTELFPAMGDEEPLFDAAALAEAVDWAAHSVEVTAEYYSPDDQVGADADGRRSIHQWVGERLVASDAVAVLYDHRSGEAADFIAVYAGDNDRVTVELYHCKASGRARAGDRTADAYEVVGQAVKSTKFRNKKRLLGHIRNRVRGGSWFLKGGVEDMVGLIEPDPRYDIPLSIYIVQPGFSRGNLSAKLASIVMAANRALVAVGCANVRILCSE